MSNWRVLIEENTGTGSNITWKITDIYEVGGGRPEARSIAYELALHHRSKHPLAEVKRTIYRINEDMWLTMVKGATTRFHYRVTVAELFTPDLTPTPTEEIS